MKHLRNKSEFHRRSLAVLLCCLSSVTLYACDHDNSPSDDSPECTTSDDCAANTDGRTECDLSKQQCIKPGKIDPDENDKNKCDQDADCAGRSDGKTKCHESQHVCYAQAAEPFCGDGLINATNETCDSNNFGNRTCATESKNKAGKLTCNNCKVDKSSCVECTDNSHCQKRSDGLTVCDVKNHVCQEPPSTNAHFDYASDFTCGILDFADPNNASNNNSHFTIEARVPYTVYSQIYMKNCTEGQAWCNQIVGARLLYTDAKNASNDFSTWQSVVAVANPYFNVTEDNKNNDEFMATFAIPSEGEYRYVFSYDLKNHPYDIHENAQTVYCYVNWPEKGSVNDMGKATIVPNTSKEFCGDGVVNQSYEKCDQSDLNGGQCTDMNFIGGSLKCDSMCQYNTSECFECNEQDLSKCGAGQQCINGRCTTVKCGDGMAQGSEVCDRSELKGKKCTDVGHFVDGALGCNANCMAFDTANCVECTEDDRSLCSTGQICIDGKCAVPPEEKYCGDGKINQDFEECDSLTLPIQNCADYSNEYIAGSMNCSYATCNYLVYDCKQCTKDNLSKCERGDLCVDGVCRKPCTNEGEATYDAEGKTGEVCKNGALLPADVCDGVTLFGRGDGHCAAKDFVTIWKGCDVYLPTSKAKNCNFTVDWGDGNKESYTSCPAENLRHIYIDEEQCNYEATQTTHTVTISGSFDNWTLNIPEYNNYHNTGSRLQQIVSFGPVGLGEGAFYNTVLSTDTPIDIPDARKLTTTKAMFMNSRKFNAKIGNWDTSNVTDMSYMFFAHDVDGLYYFDYEECKFNQNIRKWDTSKVTDMSYMFSGCINFNKSLEGWDTSHVTDMKYMFAGAKNFEGDGLRGWNVSNVTDMSHMFYYAYYFNGNIAFWDTSKVTDMSYMFNNAQRFNEVISAFSDKDCSQVVY